MVPSESATPSETAPVGGAAAPIAVLSKLALKDAFSEIEATVRRTRDASSAAAQHFWQSAEKKMGLEVGISDPALGDLFGVHVLAIEDLCGRVRAHAEAALAAVDEFGQTDLGATAALLRPLAEAQNAADEEAQAALESELLDANQASSVARKRLESRIREEVFDVLDMRLGEHAVVREDVRERQRWNTAVDKLRKDVAANQRRGSLGSGLRALSGRSSSASKEETSAQLLEAMQKVGEFDESILAGLFQLQEHSVDAVRQPWASLMQIQAEYFMAQQALWAPLGSAFSESAGPESDISTQEMPISDGHNQQGLGAW